jgi:hypothetical protein
MFGERTKYSDWIATKTRFLNTTYLTNLYIMIYIDTVTYRPIARQRFGKHIPEGANEQQ